MSLYNTRIAIIVLLLSFAVNGVLAQSKRMEKVKMGENLGREFSNDWYHYKYEDDEWEIRFDIDAFTLKYTACLLYTSPSPRDATLSRMPSSA